MTKRPRVRARFPRLRGLPAGASGQGHQRESCARVGSPPSHPSGRSPAGLRSHHESREEGYKALAAILMSFSLPRLTSGRENTVPRCSTKPCPAFCCCCGHRRDFASSSKLGQKKSDRRTAGPTRWTQCPRGAPFPTSPCKCHTNSPSCFLAGRRWGALRSSCSAMQI